MSNLRNPPLFLRPSVVRALVDDVHLIARAVSQVPVLPFKLVDQPRPPAPLLVPVAEISEITRFETAHEPASNDIEHKPAAAQVGRAARKGRERADSSEEGTRARPISNKRDAERTAKRAAKAEQDQALFAAYAAGDDAEELAAQYGVSTSAIYKFAQRNGLKRPCGHPASPEIAQRNAAVAAAYAAGEEYPEIQAKFGVGRSSVYRIAMDAGVARGKAEGGRKAVGRTKAEPAIKLPRAPKPPRAKKSAATRLSTGDCAGLLTQAPDPSTGSGQSENRAEPKALPLGNNACEQHDKPVSAAVVRAAAESAPVTSAGERGFYSESAVKQRAQRAGQVRARAERAADEARKIERRSQRADEEDAAISAFQAALVKVRARKAEAVQVIAPKRANPQDEGKRVAAAFAAKAAAKSTSVPAKAAPTEHAPSREECRICGTPGFKGCDHWLPFDGLPVRPPVERYIGEREPQKFTGRRQGIGPSWL